MAEKVIARFRRGDDECIQSFKTLDDAYEFLRHGMEAGQIEMSTIDSDDGEVILSRAAFEEMGRLDGRQREGWFAVLSHALADRRADDRSSESPGISLS